MYSRFYHRCFVIGAIVVLGWVLLQFLDPFWAPLGWAAILAFPLYPLQSGSRRNCAARRDTPPASSPALTPFFIILPIVGFGIVFAQQVTLLIEYLRGAAVRRLPAAILQRLEELAGRRPGARLVRRRCFARPSSRSKSWFVSGAQNLLKSAAAVGGHLAIGVVGTLVGFFLMLFLLFFLLRDGQAMLMHLMRLVPMDAERRGRLRTT